MPPEFPDTDDAGRGIVRWAILGALAGFLVFLVALFIDSVAVTWGEGIFLGALIGAGGYAVLSLAVPIVVWAFE